MGWSIADVREHMTCRELRQWMAYNEIEPFGEARADLRAAIIAHTIATYFSGTKHALAEFMPDFERGPAEQQTSRQQTVEEMQARMLSAFNLTAKERNGEHDGPCRLADGKDG